MSSPRQHAMPDILEPTPPHLLASEQPSTRTNLTPHLGDGEASVRVPVGAGRLRTFLAYAGPGLLVAVGYMDPGNWATDLAGGAQFGYLLLSVVLISNLMAILLQHLALKLGIATGLDLAQACRERYNRPVTIALWLLAEIAIAATDLAEVIGSAIALNLLFGLPLVVGVLFTAADVLVLLLLQHRGVRYIEAVVGGLIGVIFLSFAYELIASSPSLPAVLAGLIPRPEVVTSPGALYLAIGILGATVMPHNLYLHSSIVKTRAFGPSLPERRSAVRFATLDSTLALSFAFLINAAILILAASAFHGTQYSNVADIGDAYHLLTPVLGAGLASAAFAIALLASGQNSTLTGTLAGQIVMEGFLHIRMRPWLRRLVTRGIAIVPAVIVAALYGESGVGALLVLSQVILSLQLSFAVVPLVLFTSNRKLMGTFTNSRTIMVLAAIITVVIGGLNVVLIVQTIQGWVG